MEKILVSACLLGIPCRYDGKSKSNSYVKKLLEDNTLIPLCPEQLGGLTTPRDKSEINIINGKRVVLTDKGKDVTNNYYKGAEIVLNFCKENNIKKAILMENSPSCGSHTYDGTFNKVITDRPGILYEMLINNGIEVISLKHD